MCPPSNNNEEKIKPIKLLKTDILFIENFSSVYRCTGKAHWFLFWFFFFCLIYSFTNFWDFPMPCFKILSSSLSILNLHPESGFWLCSFTEDRSHAAAGRSGTVRHPTPQSPPGHKHLYLVVSDHFWWAVLLHVMLGPEPSGKPLTFLTGHLNCPLKILELVLERLLRC